ncbi:MAG: DNA methyltransferase, partial [Gemmatimonadota bacterium]|nr:DNA methyltransferase [Gemmatimonadota bacterium]
MLRYKRTEQDYLTFRGNRVSTGRNKIHPYPAMLHPMLVDFLIDKHGISGNIIFDPFCGSGTTLLRAGMRGFKSYGLDVNPLAILISKAKTQIYSSDLILEFEDLKRDILENESPLFFDNTKIDIPDIRNMSYWFSSEATRSLGIIRSALAKDYKYRDFFVTNFAFVCRDQSYTRKGEFKRYRITEDKIRKTKDESVYSFVNKPDRMIHEFLN